MSTPGARQPDAAATTDDDRPRIDGEASARESWVTATDGVRLRVTEFGEAEAPVVLAVHGFASNARANWVDAGWVRSLVKEGGRRVIVFDQRGHGRSDVPRDAGAATLPRLVDDVEAVLAAAGVDGVDLLGYSLGARVCWEYAVRHPDRVRTLSLGGFDGGDPLTGLDARGREAAGASADAIRAMAQSLPGNDPEALLALAAGIRSAPVPAPLAVTPPDCPVLVACGDADELAPQGVAFAAAVPRASFVPLAGRTHVNAITARAFKRAVLTSLAG